MTKKNWERLKPLFEQAVGLRPEERAAFLNKVRLEDEELGRDLAELAAAESETHTLDHPFVDLHRVAASEQRYFQENELVLGRFRIVRFLGRGGMGEVYEADDLHLGKVALKTIRPVLAASHQNMLRFKQEVQLARRVTDPHVCRIHDLFTVPESEERPSANFLTMEFLPGVTLARRIESEGPLPLPEAESVALQLCSALQAIHDSGVIHRDFKSNNVMLVPRNSATHATVMDLGLAREVEPSDMSESGLTASGVVMGTPEYMAPEQFSGQHVGAPADIYALGVVLYEIVTGRHPFHASTPLGAAVMRAKRPSAASSIRPGLRPQWDAVINRCLEFEPEARWASASEVAKALTGSPAAAPHRVFGLAPASLWRAAVAATLVVAIAAGMFWWQSHSYSRPSPDAERWYLQGVAALREGTYYKATQALTRATELDKDFVLAHARLADAWAELDFTGKAKDEILRASTLETRRGVPSADRTYLDAVRATLTYDYATAVSDYRTILERLPDAEKAYGYVDLGRAEEKAGNLPAALKDYSEAARRAPEDPAAFVHLGIIDSRQGKTGDGETAFAKADALYRASSNVEGTAEIAYQRGYAASLRGDTAHARDELTQSLRTAQDIASVQLQIRALTRMSTVEYLADNTEKSILFANESIQLAREKGLDYWAIDGLVRLGNAYLTRNDSALAEPPLQEALRLASEGGRPRLAAAAELSLASIRSMQNKPDEVGSYAQKALDYYQPAGFANEAISALTLMVRSERDTGNYQAALPRAQQALEIVKKLNNPALLLQTEESIGSVLLDTERYPEALAHFEAALVAARSINQSIEYELLHCADALWRLGSYAEAQSLLAEVPASFSKRKPIRQSLDRINAQMRLSQGRYREAAQLAEGELLEKKILPVPTFVALSIVAGTASARLASPRVAEQMCGQALDRAAKSSDPTLKAAVELCIAEVSPPEDSARALQAAQSGLKAFSNAGKRESEWRGLLTLSRIQKSLGDSAGSIRSAEQAATIVAQIERDWGLSVFAHYKSRPDVGMAQNALPFSNLKGR